MTLKRSPTRSRIPLSQLPQSWSGLCAWSIANLAEAGLLRRPLPGAYEITERGHAVPA